MSNEPQFNREGRVVCPANIDRDLAALHIEFGKARVEIADLKSIVTNGLQSDVTEIKQMVGHVRFLSRLIPVLAAATAIAKGVGLI